MIFGIPYQYTLSHVLRARLVYLRDTFAIREQVGIQLSLCVPLCGPLCARLCQAPFVIAPCFRRHPPAGLLDL